MAQDVQRIEPGAVWSVDGVLRVNYDRIDAELKRIDEEFCQASNRAH